MRLFLILLLTFQGLTAFSRVIGEKAYPPFSSVNVQVVVINKYDFKVTESGTLIHSALDELLHNYKVRLNQQVLGGYILDANQNGVDDEKYKVDVVAKFLDPIFAPWFHNPVPSDLFYQQKTEFYRTYATDKSVREQYKDMYEGMFSSPQVITNIDHAYIPIKSFDKDNYYFDKSNGNSSNVGLENVLHEALHIWHFRYASKVDRLLNSPNSFFQKISFFAKKCPNLINEYGRIKTIEMANSSLPCSGLSYEQTMQLIAEGLWPQRFGKSTNRFFSKEPDADDLHSLANEKEYFAILMQLYVFDRQNFDRVATEIEKDFAKQMFKQFM